MLLKLEIDVTEEGKFVTVYLIQRDEIVTMSPAFKSIKQALDFADFAVRDVNNLSESFPVSFVYDKTKTVDDDLVFSINV